MSQKKINLLILPSLFPNRDKNHINGIFILDYMRSVSTFCKINVFIISSSNNYNLKVYEELGATVYEYSFFGFKQKNIITKLWDQLNFFFFGFFKILRTINNIDLIHAHGGTRYGYLARFLSKSFRVPYLITEHTGPFSKISSDPLKKYFCKKAMENASAVLCVSKDLEKQIIDSGINPKRSIVTYNPVDTNLFRISNHSKNKMNIIFVGRLEEYKGGLRTLRAFQKLHEKYPKWRLTIIGNGPEEKIIVDYIKKRNLSKKVICKGEMQKKHIYREMKKATFFVFPSYHETFGLVIAEAMSCGLPVITTNKTAPPEFVNEKSGVLVNSKSIEDIASAMEHMMLHNDKYNDKYIRKMIVDNFSFKIFSIRLEKIYRELLF